MSVSTPLLDTIEPDEPTVVPSGNINSTAKPTSRTPVVLTPSSRNVDQMASTDGDAESGTVILTLGEILHTDLLIGIAGIFRQVSLSSPRVRSKSHLAHRSPLIHWRYFSSSSSE